MKTNRLVMVIDSGVGGLSICREIRRKMPDAGLLYVADNAWFPYGGRDPRELEARLLALLRPLCHRYAPDAVVIACNTASTSVLPHLREALSLPIVGVVPAIKPAARMSTTKVIGLLATPGTVGRGYVDQLIADFAAECRVVRLGSERLVRMAEAQLRGKQACRVELAELLAPMIAEGAGEMDTVVLGCTHFPLLAEALALSAPSIVNWVDSGAAIARRVDAVALSRAKPPNWLDQAIFTADDPTAQALSATMTDEGFLQVQFGIPFS